LINVKGTLYGTTYSGGTQGLGTVFSVTTTGTEKVLHSFGGGYDGANPYAGLIDVNGTLYGTTFGGGKNHAHCCGTVFSVTTTGTEKVLHKFGERFFDGWYPEASLININGTLYGTTSQGGQSVNGGIFFSITTTGTEKVLHKFGGAGYDGSVPRASLINVKGSLFGTTYSGGAHGLGTLFRVTTAGKEKVLYSFSGKPDGAYPSAALINVNGTLYSTSNGGGYRCRGAGCGTVFTLTP
jgi:uncharacterized repeat protein (TIGR03803 family)